MPDVVESDARAWWRGSGLPPDVSVSVSACRAISRSWMGARSGGLHSGGDRAAPSRFPFQQRSRRHDRARLLPPERVKAVETTSYWFWMKCFSGRFVDPRNGGQLGRVRPSVAEAGGVGSVGRVKGHHGLGADFGGGAVVHRSRGMTNSS